MSPKRHRLRATAFGVAMFVWGVANGSAAATVPNAAVVPPAPVIEKPLAPAANDTPGEQPSAQHVWVPGHWRWHEGAYVWEAGRWEIPPAPNVMWDPPQWQQQGSGYVLREGYWQEAERASAAATSGSAPQPQIIVTAPPPPAQRELIPGRPTAVHVWMPGYWAWDGRQYQWIAGRWEQPARPNLLWVPPRWELRGGRYVFIDGYWREAAVVVPSPPPPVATAPAQQIIVVTPPPTPRHEVVYARPSPRHLWVPGYWSWHAGRYVWIAGHYALPPRGRSRWIEPRWERRGGNYLFVEGHWR